jgi:hypothetical protein
MNALFLTQSGSLRLFEALGRRLVSTSDGERLGFVVADSWHYRSWIAEHPDFESRSHAVLKEWEVTARRERPFDPDAVRRACERLGAPDLFNAVVADRRLIMGADCTFTQDYRRRFDDRTLYSILGAGIEAMESLFDTVRPGLVMGFICNTFLDYIGDAVARARGIPCLNLRTTRIGNRVTAATTLCDPSPEFLAAFRRIRTEGSPFLAEARTYLDRVRTTDGRYEGVVPPSSRPALSVSIGRSPIARITRFARNVIAYRSGPSATDNHCPGLIRPLLFQAAINPIRARRVDRWLRPGYVTPDSLSPRRFAFMPLHTEPEVSQLVYARPLVNQIEVARSLAYSLPADMALVLKEHPWMVGKRRLAAYRKFLDIPRVRFAAPEIDARAFVQRASLVTVLTSSVGLEAAILGKPVLTFGHAPFNALPEHLVRRAVDLLALPGTIGALMADHRSDDDSLAAYVAAALELSVPANLYSVLLGRANVHSIGAADFDADIERLASHVRERLAAFPTAA